MYTEIRRHGENLQRIFPKTRALDPVALSKKLLQLEYKAHQAAEDVCDGRISQDGFDSIQDSVLKNLDKLLGFTKAGVPVFVNGDPRGYALKIDDSYARDIQIQRDWGGYGILCPTFTGD